MRDFPNAINSIPHPEERPEGASRRTHRGSAADVTWVPSVRSVPLGTLAESLKRPREGIIDDARDISRSRKWRTGTRRDGAGDGRQAALSYRCLGPFRRP